MLAGSGVRPARDVPDGRERTNVQVVGERRDADGPVERPTPGLEGRATDARPATPSQPDAGGQAGLTGQLRVCSHGRAQDPKIAEVLTQTIIHRLWTNVAARFCPRLWTPSSEKTVCPSKRETYTCRFSNKMTNSHLSCLRLVLLYISVRGGRRPVSLHLANSHWVAFEWRVLGGLASERDCLSHWASSLTIRSAVASRGRVPRRSSRTERAEARAGSGRRHGRARTGRTARP